MVDSHYEGRYANIMASMEEIKGALSLSVSDLTRYLRQVIESDDVLQDVWVQGEVSNLARPGSGHIYFTLKDIGASLRCVLWRNNAIRLASLIKEGIAIEVHGNVTVYDAAGQYQMIVDGIRSKGEGILYQEFIRLKKLLEEEGLFDPDRKLAIPLDANRIGIITSLTGASLQDVLNTIRRRNPLLNIFIVPSAVQGESAPLELISAIAEMKVIVKPELILIVRGGGSIEDLWVFNDENVVRAIAACEIPTITGIGHETDFTLSDFAADLRAPTPTAAAELATPKTILDLKNDLKQTSEVLFSLFEQSIEQKKDQVNEISARLTYISPERRIQSEWQTMDGLTRRLNSTQLFHLSIKKTRIVGLVERLTSLNPMDVIKRGYAVVTRTVDYSLITRIGQLSPGEDLSIQVQDGSILAQTTNLKPEMG